MTQILESHGFRWMFHEGSDDGLAIGNHEQPVIMIARAHMPQGGVFVDVGAHVGLYSFALSDKAATCLAIEANEKTFDTLVENVVLNAHALELKDCLIVPKHAAIWETSGAVLELFDAHEMESGGSTGAVALERGAMPVGECVSVTLDDLLDDQPVDLVKIDVEGAEVQVLRGAEKVMATQRPKFLIEMHDVYLPDPHGNRDAVEDILVSRGYVHGKDLSYGGAYHWMALPEENA